MTLDELVGNLKIYKMNMNNFKKVETKDKSLALKASESDDSDLDEEQLTFIIKNFRKFFKKDGRNDRKGTSSRRLSNERSQGVIISNGRKLII